MKTTRYTVITDSSRLGKWLTSRAKCEKIATKWAELLGRKAFVKVVDEHGNVVFSAAA